ncbi:MAG: riboflavin synthase [Chloroflexi bacterium]|nr:riboflavin synthase [Chloroflexota bacterium]
MFTGIVEEIGIVRGISSGRLTIEAKKVLEDTKPGGSMAINGACLTVTSISKDNFSVDVMPETIRRANLGRLHYGELVNLERAMSAEGRFGGHFVQGHVDDVGKVLSLQLEEEAVIARISAPAHLMPYMVNKGFIAVDGVSLTVIDCDDFSFSVSLVTYTREHTTLGNRKPGDIVNLEVDIIAKYVERLKQRYNRGVLTLDFLEEHGFLKAR